MSVELQVKIASDGSLDLRWDADTEPSGWMLLIQRTGAVLAHTALLLSADTRATRIDHLGRHQRYRLAVLGLTAVGDPQASAWWTATPRQGLTVLKERDPFDLSTCTARAEDLLVMPQAERLTAWWKLTPGFVDQIVVELWQAEDLIARLDLEPEVTSLSVDATRGVPLTDGRAYQLVLRTGFGGHLFDGPPPVVCVPAAQGAERAANRDLPQEHLVYPTLSLSPELDVFGEGCDPESAEPGGQPAAIVCMHCRREVTWDAWRLRCPGCGAEFIPNGRGAYLDVARLRFGTCRCCLPKKILIQKAGSASLVCAHTGKEHIRAPGAEGHALIEDLPYGLCQCCRPRRPLTSQRGKVVCSKSSEQHVNQAGRWALKPSAPVFDASAIDALLDAGLAEISATGVSRTRSAKRKHRTTRGIRGSK